MCGTCGNVWFVVCVYFQAPGEVRVEEEEEKDECQEPANKRVCSYLLGDVEDLGVEDGPSSSELAQYQREPVRETDPLVWWRLNEGRFPKLASLAKEYLSLPATEVPCERVFSAAGLTISRLRASLDGDTADKLLFLNKNARSLFKSALPAVQDEEVLPLIETVVNIEPRSVQSEMNTVPMPPSLEEEEDFPLAVPLPPTPSRASTASTPPSTPARRRLTPASPQSSSSSSPDEPPSTPVRPKVKRKQSKHHGIARLFRQIAKPSPVRTRAHKSKTRRGKRKHCSL